MLGLCRSSCFVDLITVQSLTNIAIFCGINALARCEIANKEVLKDLEIQVFYFSFAVAF
jgi:hypothetical protein